MCLKCNKSFQSKRQNKRQYAVLWRKYVWGKQSLKQLADAYGKSLVSIQNRLDKARSSKKKISPQKIVAIADVTFFGRYYGILVVRSEKLQKNLFWKEVTSETPQGYAEAKHALKQQGFELQAIVLDGRKGVRQVFYDIPVQMCHFHQKMILKRYLTSRPKLEAGQELRAIGETLTFIQEKDFTFLLSEWYEKWKYFLKEKTYEEDGNRWHYTHKKLRSAYRSLKENSSYLFTYQKYPDINIPKTTNSLDGTFGHMKTLLKVHRGLSRKRRFKVIEEILRK